MAGRTLSVRARLTLISTAVAVVALGTGAVLLYMAATSSLSDALTEELRIGAQDVRDELEQGLAVPDQGLLLTQVLAEDGTVDEPAGQEPLVAPDVVARAGAGEVVVEDLDADPPLRRLALPVTLPDGTREVVVVAGSRAVITRGQERLALLLAVAAPLTAGFTALVAWYLAGAALRPVRAMSRRAASLSATKPGGSLPVPPGKDELAELGATLNDLLARIADAVARERQFLDDASHELRAPLAVVRGELELAELELDDRGGDPETRRALVSAVEDIDRLAELTDRLLLLARADAGILATVREPVAVRDLARRIVERLPAADPVITVTGTDVAVEADPAALGQVITNLVVNARRYARSRVAVTVGRVGADAVLRVDDDGPGFEPTYLAHPFERFRRGDPARGRAGSGGGLGLAIAAAVVDAHRGSIEVGNDGHLGGAWAEVRLPIGLEQAPVPTGRPAG